MMRMPTFGRNQAANTSTPGWEESVAAQTDTAFSSLKRDAILNFAVRIALYAAALLALGLGLIYAYRRGDQMVTILLNLSDGENFDYDRLLALTVPVILLLIFAAVTLGCALLVQSRGAGDFATGLESVSRLRREAQAGVSRSRSTAHVLEEYVANARRAFRLQLWLSRALFVVCGGLFATAVLSGVINDVDVSTVALGAGSLLALLLSTLTESGPKVGTQLADATQIQIAVSGTTQQVNLLEEHLFKIIEARNADGTGLEPAQLHTLLKEGVAEMAAATDRGVALIQDFAEPPNKSDEQGQQSLPKGHGLAGGDAAAGGLRPADADGP